MVKPIIMTIDDSEFMLKMVELTLSACYEVRSMRSAELALEQLENEIPQLILLDVTMTGISGFDFFKLTRLQPRFRNIPIIFLALEGRGAEKLDAINLGAMDYIAKPFTAAFLKARVDLYVNFFTQMSEMKSENKRLQLEILDLKMLLDAKNKQLIAR